MKRYTDKHPWVVYLYSARQRCRDPKVDSYKYYGAKGVACFLSASDVKKMWFRDKAEGMKKASLDRIDPNGNYVLENCRFIEFSENVMMSKPVRNGCFVCGPHKKHLCRNLCSQCYWKLWAFEKADARKCAKAKGWLVSTAIRKIGEGKVIDAAIRESEK